MVGFLAVWARERPSRRVTGTVEIVALRPETELRADLARDARRGLGAQPKTLPAKYFYDARGSELFERITELPEYYLTRAETSILTDHAAEIIAAARPEEIVEIGGGVSRKTELLLDAFEARGGGSFVSLDVSADALADAGDRLASTYRHVDFFGVVGDFERDLERIPRHGRRLVAFLGSTIGNLDLEERARFLRSVRAMLVQGDRFLLGVDLVKSTERLVAAYDDAAGVTAEFNRNVLEVLNRELEGDLPVDAFAHRARYDEELERIEMALVAERAVRARLERIELDVVFVRGEEVRTEISCKFRREGVESELASAGLGPERWLTDEAGDFALVLAEAKALEGAPGVG